MIAADLTRSGLFDRRRRWNRAGSDRAGAGEFGSGNQRREALVIGSVNPTGDGRFEVRFRLMDVVKARARRLRLHVAGPQLRLTAHKIADVIYEKSPAIAAYSQPVSLTS